MYSKEFMKFLYGYQKDEFKPVEPKCKEIRFKNPRSGKLAEILLTVKNSFYKLKFSKSINLESRASDILTRVEYLGSIVPHSILLIVRVVRPVFNDKSS